MYYKSGKQKSNKINLPIGAETIIDVLNKMSHKYPNHNALMTNKNDIWINLTYSDFFKQVRIFAKGLRMRGIKKGDTVGIIGMNSKEWFIAHLGCLMIGAISVGIYPTNNKEACEYIINHSKIKMIVVENKKQFDKFNLDNIHTIISYSEPINNNKTFKNFIYKSE